MPRLSRSVPSYRHHKASGQAFVELDGRRHYLGSHGSPASKTEYERLTGEWLANGRRAPAAGQVNDRTVAELLAAYFAHAQGYYRDAAGQQTSEVDTLRQALRPLLRLYGRTRVADFGPLALKAVRQAMIDAPPAPPVSDTPPKAPPSDGTGAVPVSQPRRRSVPWCRGYANKQVARIKLAFKWGVENELVPAGVYHAMQAVSGLRKGRTGARESERVRPVPAAHVDAALPYFSPQVAAMVRLQLLTGMRPGEVVLMRTGDLTDTTSKVWTYRPSKHKTEHHGHAREIKIGPKGQAVLRPHLKSDLAAFIFSPADAEAWRHEQQRAARRTPLTPSQARRAEAARRRRAKRAPGERFTVASYRRSIAKACARADRAAHAADPTIPAERLVVPPFHPHQLRHSAATEFRRLFGLEAARVLLGHRSAAITEVYAEQDTTHNAGEPGATNSAAPQPVHGTSR